MVHLSQTDLTLNMVKMMINIDISNLKDEDTYSLILSLLYSLKDCKKSNYSTISELSFILDKDNFLKFIQYYGGQTITIPTIDDIQRVMRTLLLYQYYKIDNKSWDESMQLAGIPADEGYKANLNLNKFCDMLKKTNLGRNRYD